MSYILSREKEIVSKEVLEGFDHVYTKCWSKNEFLMTLIKMRWDFLFKGLSQHFGIRWSLHASFLLMWAQIGDLKSSVT